MAWRNKIYFFGIASLLAWALFVLMLYNDATEKDSEAIDSIALNEARIAHRKDIIYRRWASRMGGMFVEVTDSLLPNPYLDIPGRDVTTQDGRNLTLVNPAYMTRMVHSLMQEDDGLKAHITSLSPIRPQNAPDEWERKALESFNAGNAEAHEFLESNGEHVLRYMKPMLTEESCLRCHARQGYKTGDIRGGISVTVPMRKYDSIRHASIVGTRKRYASFLFTGSGFLAALFAMLLVNERIRARAAAASRESEDALRLSQAQMAMSMEMAAMGHWRFDVASRTFFFTDEFFVLYGTSAQREGGSYMSAERYAHDFVHPEDAGMVAEEVERLFKCDEPDYYRQLEHRIVRRDGEVRHIVVRFSAIRDEAGAVIKTFGVNQDITERKNVEEAMRTSLREKEIMLREIHHRVKNNLQIISSLLSLQENVARNRDAVTTLRDSQTRVMSMALIHEHLYKASDIGGVDAGGYVAELLGRIQRAYQGGCPVSVSLDIAPMTLTLDQAIPFGLIMAELATNAFKHAFTDEAAQGSLRVRGRLENGHAAFTLEDSGPGLPEGFAVEGSESLGLRIVSMLADQLHGRLGFGNDGGLSAHLEFPVR